MLTSWTKCKRNLAVLWFTGSGVIFFILLFQTIFQRYEGRVSEVWEWFLPTIMPTLSLIVGVLVMDALGKKAKKQTVDRFVFKLSFSLSFVYLVVVALTILMPPFPKALPTLELMQQSNLWLGPFQGLVTASLGAFFICGK